MKTDPKSQTPAVLGNDRMHARTTAIRIRRPVRTAVAGVLLALGGCLPSNYFADLAGSSLSAVVSVLLSDAVNFVLPPP